MLCENGQWKTYFDIGKIANIRIESLIDMFFNICQKEMELDILADDGQNRVEWEQRIKKKRQQKLKSFLSFQFGGQ